MGKGVTIIDAAQLDRVFDIFDGATVEFRDLTITGGFLDYSHGAGIYARFGSTVTLTNVEITSNVVQSTGAGDRHGGGIWANQATITGTGVDITDNRAERNGGANNMVGGGMWLSGDSAVTLTDRDDHGQHRPRRRRILHERRKLRRQCGEFDQCRDQQQYRRGARGRLLQRGHRCPSSR
jgi:hypothetical protein